MESRFYYTEIYIPFPVKMKDIQQKLAIYAKVLRILNITFKSTLVQKFSRLDALAVPIVLYGSEIWNHRKEDKKRLTSVEIKFVRRTAGYTLFDHKRNEKICKS